MIAFITCNSNLVPLLEGLCSSNPWRFEFSIFGSFCRNRTEDLRINSPALWPTELVLHRPGCKLLRNYFSSYLGTWCEPTRNRLICFFNVLPPHISRVNYSRSCYRWCAVIRKPGSAWLEGTPAIWLIETISYLIVCRHTTSTPTTSIIFFVVMPGATQLALQLHQERTQVVCSNGAPGSPEAPGSKALLQWTLNLKTYAHTCRQTKEK